eukprot:1153006-Amphidinium_carterae.2
MMLAPPELNAAADLREQNEHQRYQHNVRYPCHFHCKLEAHTLAMCTHEGHVRDCYLAGAERVHAIVRTARSNEWRVPRIAAMIVVQCSHYTI